MLRSRRSAAAAGSETVSHSKGTGTFQTAPTKSVHENDEVELTKQFSVYGRSRQFGNTHPINVSSKDQKREVCVCVHVLQQPLLCIVSIAYIVSTLRVMWWSRFNLEK